MTSSPLWYLTVARLKLFYREPSTVFWTFGFPILLSIALGIAFREKPPEPVQAAVVEGAGAATLIEALEKSPDLRVRKLSEAEGKLALRSGRVSLLVLPGDPRIYEYDPTRPESRLARATVDDVLQRAQGRQDVVTVSERHVVEPGSRYIDFLIPGLLGLNIMSSGMWGVGWVIVEMRMRKLLKRMVATPMRRTDFLLSFLLMRLVFLAVEVPVLLSFGVLAFGVPLRGSLAVVGLTTLMGALAFTGLGLLVACRAENTQTVSGLINVVMMPMFLLSGVFFSSANFPDVMQPVIKALPLTALNDALRAIMNEGAGLVTVAPQLALLAAVTAVTFALSLRFFRWT